MHAYNSGINFEQPDRYHIVIIYQIKAVWLRKALSVIIIIEIVCIIYTEANNVTLLDV